MIPSGWSVALVRDLCTLESGNGFKPSDWKSSGLPIIRIQNLNGSKEFNYFQGHPEKRWLVEPGQILFAWAGVKGVSFGPKIWNGPRGVLNQHIFKVHPKPGVEKSWLYLALMDVTQRIEENAHGFKSSLLHVRRDDILDQEVGVPTPAEQARISKAVVSWEVAISTTESLIAAKQQRKQALMQKLLTGKMRLPGFKTPWAQTQIRSFLTESRNPGSDGSSARKLTVKLYGNGVVPRSERMVGSDNTKYYRRKAGQFIYGKLDFLNGAFGIVPPSLDGYESTLDLPAFDFSPGINPEFFLSFVGQTSFYAQFSGAAEGGRKARRIQVDEFLDASILVPDPKEQAAIARVLGAADTELRLLIAKKTALESQKKALMAVLLTGKKRLKA
ncbi:MAG: restriction endonuclease subunit S [Gammaproteobacteria bacterium]